MIYVEDDCLSNAKSDTGKPGKGEVWQFYLFCHEGSPEGELFIETIEGETEKERNESLRSFMRRRDVKLIRKKNEP